MVQFIDTTPSIVPVSIVVDPVTLFSAANQSVAIANGPGEIREGTRLMAVSVHKETPMDTNSIAFGTGSTSGARENIASFAEVDATVAGVVDAAAWRAAGAFGDLLLTDGRAIYARLGGGNLPTAGLIRLTLFTWLPTPRATL